MKGMSHFVTIVLSLVVIIIILFSAFGPGELTKLVNKSIFDNKNILPEEEEDDLIPGTVVGDSAIPNEMLPENERTYDVKIVDGNPRPREIILLQGAKLKLTNEGSSSVTMSPSSVLSGSDFHFKTVTLKPKENYVFETEFVSGTYNYKIEGDAKAKLPSGKIIVITEEDKESLMKLNLKEITGNGIEITRKIAGELADCWKRMETGEKNPVKCAKICFCRVLPCKCDQLVSGVHDVSPISSDMLKAYLNEENSNASAALIMQSRLANGEKTGGNPLIFENTNYLICAYDVPWSRNNLLYITDNLEYTCDGK